MGKAKKVVTNPELSPFRKYQDVIVGSRSLLFLLRFEVNLLVIGPLPGTLGLALRKIFFRGMFKVAASNAVFGRSLTIRHPGRIRVGENVVVDDLCVLDGRSEHEVGLEIGARTMIARNVQIQAKGGRISIGRSVGIGANCVIHAQPSNEVTIGDHALIAPYTYLGGTIYNMERTDVPIQLQGTEPQGGVRIGEGAWIGSGVSVVDGVSVGRHAVVGAGAVVTKDVPEYAIAGGIPARVIRSRLEEATAS